MLHETEPAPCFTFPLYNHVGKVRGGCFLLNRASAQLFLYSKVPIEPIHRRFFVPLSYFGSELFLSNAVQTAFIGYSIKCTIFSLGNIPESLPFVRQ